MEERKLYLINFTFDSSELNVSLFQFGRDTNVFQSSINEDNNRRTTVVEDIEEETDNYSDAFSLRKDSTMNNNHDHYVD